MKKLSTETLSVLKNFADINKNLFVNSGNVLSTISEARNIYAKATVEESFPQNFGIYDLNEFLNAFNLLDDAELSFKPDSVLMTDGKAKLTYRFADESVLTFPTKEVKLPAADLTLNITASDLSQIRKATSVLGQSIAAIRRVDDAIMFVGVDPKNSISNSYSINVGEAKGDAQFDLHFLISNFKLLPGDYTVDISSKLISKWAHNTLPVEYYIAIEKTSTYSE
jgi:hypothetical protein